MPSHNPLVYLGDIQKRAKVLAQWEKQRNKKEVHWLMECFAEALGVFLYAFAGVGSTLGFILGTITNTAGLGSVLQIGIAYTFGIYFALGIASGTSGGHFNPAVTVAMVVFRGFPPLKAVRYIIAQIFGGYVACMVVYYQWKPLVDEMIHGLVATGHSAILYTPNGPPGAFALYLLPEMTFGAVFLNEFVCCVFVALVIWASLDPTNVMISPAMGPIAISLAYGVAIWSFATPGIALNAARDVGGRLWAISVWGLEAGGGKYAAIAALTNIPATLFAIVLYEIFLVDSDKPVTPAALQFHALASGNRRIHNETAHETDENGADSRSSDKQSINVYEVTPNSGSHA